ncbi:VOC family protein [Actinomadura sediminis]|uniref:VOC family protein n=1 Tax=Actinomadura sediminis TaxID=1038904 RepID=A0ABW3EI33_9ACTN
MEIERVLAAIAVSDLGKAKEWYEVLFGRPADAEPMAGLAEWRGAGGVVQLVADRRRAGGSLVTLQVPDARRALDELAARGGPSVEPDDTTSDIVVFTTLTDPDGNAITVVQVREGAAV